MQMEYATNLGAWPPEDPLSTDLSTAKPRTGPYPTWNILQGLGPFHMESIHYPKVRKASLQNENARD